MITKYINGFKVVYKKIDSPIATTRIIVNCGSINEKYSIPKGIAHYLEHLAFKDACLSKKYSSIGEFNAYTCTSRTVYYANYAKKNFENATKVLCNMVFGLKITKEIIESERNIILEEFYPTLYEPVEKFSHLKEEIIWGEEYHSVLGTKSSINSIGLTNLQLFKECFYTRNNIIIAICGNIDFKKIEKTINKITKMCDFETMEPYTNYPKKINPITKNVHIKHITDHAIVSLDFPNMNCLDLSNKTNMAITRIFATIFASEFFPFSVTHTIIKEKLGLCYEISGYNVRRKGLNYFSIFAKTSKENVPTIKKELLKQLLKIKKDGIDSKVLQMAKENAEYFTLESSIGPANYSFNYLDALFYNHNETPEENIKYNKRVTNLQIQKYAGLLLEHNNYIVTTLY